MSVASWLRSVFTTQDPTTYKSAIDGNFAVIERVSAMFAPQQAATPNMTVVIRSGALLDNGTLVERAQQTTGTITAPASTSRIDRIVLDQRTGVFTVVAGTPGASPVAPAIPAGKLPCAQVLLQSTSTVITNAMITDERVFVSDSAAVLSALYAPRASPALTGTPTAPTAPALTNSTRLATTAYADASSAAAAAALIPATTAMLFNQTAAPTGWTKSTTHNDKALRVVSGTVGSGGTNAFSTALVNATSTAGYALTIADIPAHTHTSAAAAAGNNIVAAGGIGVPITGAATGSTGGGGAHSHGLTLGVQYVDVIIATKN